MAQKAAAILEGEPSRGAPLLPVPDGADLSVQGPYQGPGAPDSQSAGNVRDPQGSEGAVLRAILDAASECLGRFDDRPQGERWCDTLFHLLDLAALAERSCTTRLALSLRQSRLFSWRAGRCSAGELRGARRAGQTGAKRSKECLED